MAYKNYDMLSLQQKVNEIDNKCEKDYVDEKVNDINSSLEEKANRLNETYIYATDFGAVGNANYLDWTTMTYYTDSTKTTVATDDTDAIDNAIAKAKEKGQILYFPNGHYKYNRVFTIDGFCIKGDKAILELCGDNGVNIIRGDDYHSLIDGVGLVGQSKTGSIGLQFSMETIASSARNLHKVNIFNFDTDIQFNSNSYLINFYESKFSSCNYSLMYPSGLTNSGENITFNNCVFSSKECCVSILGYGEIKFNNCSFD